MIWNLPNQLTVGRIALAAVFFLLLGLYEPSPAGGGAWVLLAAFVVFLIAGVTDVLDGYLARKMKLTSAFGRIADPFVDKVLTVGAFAMMTGRNFAFHAGTPAWERALPHWLTGGMASGVQAWMVVAILGREFIVSAVRGYSESQGVKFPATSAGKLKMFVQSVTIGTVLIQTAFVVQPAWAVGVKLSLTWLATVVTVLSGLVYVGHSRKLLGAAERQLGD